MAKSSSEIIAEQLAERWRQRVAEQNMEIFRLKNRVIELVKTVEYLLQRLQEAGVKLDETGEAP